eukprot:jgi/Ulvmu1/6173/UM028_0029.1
MQSPIHFEHGLRYNALPASLRAHVNLPVVKDLVAKNIGHGLQVEWSMMIKDWEQGNSLPVVPAGGTGVAAALLGNGQQPTRNVSLVPVQMHFHTGSEHMVNGMFHAAELHIVTLVAEGAAPEWGCDDVWQGGIANFGSCAAVFATMFNVGRHTFEDATINLLLDRMPLAAATSAEVTAPATLDLNMLLPSNRTSLSYFGSLTTPGCSEGVRWHVHREPLEITATTLSRLYSATANTIVGGERQIYRTNNRVVQPVNNRTIWITKASASSWDTAVAATRVDSIR